MRGRAGRWSMAVVGAWIALAGIPPASADSRAPANTPEQTPADLVRQGTERFLHQDYEGARAVLARAYELAPSAATLLKLALAELQSRHSVEAAAHFREYLTHVEEPRDKLEVVRTKWLPRAESETARLLVTAPPGAEILVDGVAQGQAPLDALVVATGPHEVTARQGTLLETQVVTPHEAELVELHFQRIPSPLSDSGASQAPAIIVSSVQASDPGDSAQRAKWTTVVALGSGALVAAGLGVAFAIAANRNDDSAQALRTTLDHPPNSAGSSACFGAAATSSPCAQLRDDVQAHDRNATFSIAAYAGAGALGAAALATSLLWRPRSSNRAVALRPTVGVRSAGLTLSSVW